jgi:hypothetical protein
MKPNFDYLKALAIGKSRSREMFREALEDVVSKHGGKEVATAAENILNRMDNLVEQKEKRETIYKKNFRDEHVLVIMVPNLSARVEEVKLLLSNYNVANKGTGTMKINAVVFDGETQMVSVKSFKNKEEAESYLFNLSQYPEFEEKVTKNNYTKFLISTENFAYFYREKNIGEYLSFYTDNYGND